MRPDARVPCPRKRGHAVPQASSLHSFQSPTSRQDACGTLGYCQLPLRGKALRAFAKAMLILAVIAQPASAQLMSRSTQQNTLIEALRSYDRGVAQLRENPNEALNAFRIARDGFQGVINSGAQNGNLYYNLGNAHLRLNEIGRAIAAYRRAEKLIPGDEQLRNNLRFARSLCRDTIRASGQRTFLRTILFLHYSLTFKTRIAVALIAYGLFWFLLLLRLFNRRVRLGYVTLLALFVWVTLAVSIAMSWPDPNRADEGALVADDVMVRKGDGESYAPLFAQPLHQGVEFQVIEQRSGWVHIELADGNQGWVRDREVTFF